MSITVPCKGDYVYLDFNPQSGKEKRGRRSAIVLTPEAFNRVTGFAVICPITNTVKNWPFQVHLPDGEAFTGAIETDQLKSLDWQARNIQIVGKATNEVLDECLARIEAFLEL